MKNLVGVFTKCCLAGVACALLLISCGTGSTETASVDSATSEATPEDSNLPEAKEFPGFITPEAIGEEWVFSMEPQSDRLDVIGADTVVDSDEGATGSFPPLPTNCDENEFPATELDDTLSADYRSPDGTRLSLMILLGPPDTLRYSYELSALQISCGRDSFEELAGAGTQVELSDDFDELETTYLSYADSTQRISVLRDDALFEIMILDDQEEKVDVEQVVLKILAAYP